MRSSEQLMTVVKLVLMAVLAIYVAWQLPGLYRAPISPAEAKAYLDTLQSRALPEAIKTEILTTAKAFMDKDDGQPFHMLNLMRYHDTIDTRGLTTTFTGTPEEANAHYEAHTMPLLFKHGGQPVYTGTIHDDNLLTQASALNHWSRLLLIRYPSRRAFMDLVTDPAYAGIAPYKIMALNVVLTPSTSEMVLPPLWLIALILLGALAANLVYSLRRNAQ